MLTENQVRKYLETIQDIKKSHTLMDIHAHPFNLVAKDLSYAPNKNCNGVFSLNSSDYAASADIHQLDDEEDRENAVRRYNPELRAKMALLTSRKLYNHTGPKVFSDQMRLSGIDKVLLLPVKSSTESDDCQMDLLAEIFGNDERFELGYCVSNNVPDDAIESTVKKAVEKYKIKALKIHPNVTGIDLATNTGRVRIENILAASEATGLNVIIHGGRSTHLSDSSASKFSILDNLEKIDWGVSKQTVIIAHAGTYGHDIHQITGDILPRLNRLLRKYDNLFVDISGLTFYKIRAIVKMIDFTRILFGSDAFYNSQWSVLVSLLHALEDARPDYEEIFLRITCANPSLLFERCWLH